MEATTAAVQKMYTLSMLPESVREIPATWMQKIESIIIILRGFRAGVTVIWSWEKEKEHLEKEAEVPEMVIMKAVQEDIA